MTAGAIAAPLARARRAGGLAALAALFVVVAVASLGVGPADVGLRDALAALADLAGLPVEVDPRARVIVVTLRIPRLALGALVGAALAVAGTLMQGVVRNPLADPGLVGVSGGAALAAVATIVLGTAWLPPPLAPWGTALAAFAGAFCATIAVVRLAAIDGRVAMTTLLLAGVAVNALAMAGVGLFVFASDDRQIRDINFWMLGSVGGATPAKVVLLLPVAAIVALVLPALARGLDGLILGEREAEHLGVAVERVKRGAIALAALAVGAAVSVSGTIGFVGLLGPHFARLALGPLHGRLLPGSALLGATLVVAADMLARTLARPADLPIGVVTSLLGAPFFLGLLLARRRDLA